jgi:hypothetical protein
VSYTYSFDQYPLKELSPFDSPETIFDSDETIEDIFEIDINEIIESEGDEEPFYLDPAEWDE